METINVKEEAKHLVDQLPDNATWDQLMHKIYVRQSIENGLADSRAGRTASVDLLGDLTRGWPSQLLAPALMESLRPLVEINLRSSLFTTLFGCLMLAFGLAYPFLLPLAQQYHLVKPAARLADAWVVVLTFSIIGIYFTLKAGWLYFRSRRHRAELMRAATA